MGRFLILPCHKRYTNYGMDCINITLLKCRLVVLLMVLSLRVPYYFHFHYNIDEPCYLLTDNIVCVCVCVCFLGGGGVSRILEGGRGGDHIFIILITKNKHLRFPLVRFRCVLTQHVGPLGPRTVSAKM